MANTYTQIHIQVVFAVKWRKSLIHPAWEDQLFRYITGIVQHYDHKMLQINGMPDHIHIFLGMRPTQSISDLIQKVKRDSSAWINRQGFLRTKFAWQGGFGAFSYTINEVPIIIRYIKNQKEHHRKNSFRNEYIDLLNEFDVSFNEQYIFEPLK